MDVKHFVIGLALINSKLLRTSYLDTEPSDNAVIHARNSAAEQAGRGEPSMDGFPADTACLSFAEDGLCSLFCVAGN